MIIFIFFSLLGGRVLLARHGLGYRLCIPCLQSVSFICRIIMRNTRVSMGDSQVHDSHGHSIAQKNILHKNVSSLISLTLYSIFLHFLPHIYPFGLINICNTDIIIDLRNVPSAATNIYAVHVYKKVCPGTVT